MIAVNLMRPMDRRISIEGQSNAVGLAAQSDIAALSDATLGAYASSAFSRVLIFNPSSGNYEPLRLGVNNMGYSASQFGAEFGIAVRWMRETIKGNLYIDKNASGGQPISYFMEGTSVFTALLANTVSQNAWLSANKKRASHMGWLWVQGETDRALTQAAYEASLTTYIGSRLANSLMNGNGFRILPQVPIASTQYGAGVADAKTHYISINPSVAKTIQYGQLGGDSLHMNAKGITQFGFDAFSVFFSKPLLVLA